MTNEGYFVEINLRKTKCCSYNPKKSFMSESLQKIGKNLIYCDLNMISC